MGGALITRDIAKVCSLSIADAEKIKIINGQLIEGYRESSSTIEAKPLGEEYESLDPIEVSRAHCSFQLGIRLKIVGSITWFCKKYSSFFRAPEKSRNKTCCKLFADCTEDF